MLGAIAGDIIGSIYEWNNLRKEEFPLFQDKCFFTDDTILTVAVADAYLNKKDYVETFRNYAKRYPDGGYGGRFRQWINDEKMGPYNSFGNGSGMRVSPIGWLCKTLESVLSEAFKSASVTHNHPEGIKGAQAIASAIFLAREGGTKQHIKNYITHNFQYNLDRTIEEIRPIYKFDETCQGSVPESIIAFLESEDFESCIRKAVSIGGDTDTIACMAGSIAEAFYKGIPKEIEDNVYKVINRQGKEFMDVINHFKERVRVNEILKSGKVY